MTDIDKGRRKLVKALGASVPVIAVWQGPVIESVNLPEHGQASPPPHHAFPPGRENK